MAKKFRQLRDAMSPEAQRRSQIRAEQMLAEMPLQELRRARALSQETLAQLLGANQPQVSKIEHSTDLYLSTLRRYVEAVGGSLEIVAAFPDGAVRITQFNDIGELNRERGLEVARAGVAGDVSDVLTGTKCSMAISWTSLSNPPFRVDVADKPDSETDAGVAELEPEPMVA